MRTELFAKLPSVTLYCLKVKNLGQDDKWFKSTNLQSIHNKLGSVECYDYDIKSFEVKNTLESDDNHELCGLNSIRGEWL